MLLVLPLPDILLPKALKSPWELLLELLGELLIVVFSLLFRRRSVLDLTFLIKSVMGADCWPECCFSPFTVKPVNRLKEEKLFFMVIMKVVTNPVL